MPAATRNVLAHLVALHLHAHLPVLSGLCATTTAAMGAGVAMASLLDGCPEAVDEAMDEVVRYMAADVAGMISYLLSDESRFVTKAVYRLDGGCTG